MSFFGLFGNGPYMAWAKRLNVGYQSNVLRSATYQVVPSEHGLPMIQLDLDFQRWDHNGRAVLPLRQLAFGTTVFRDWHPATANPDMSVALLMDRSGSMSDVFNDGHVYNLCANVLNYLAAAGVGYDLGFYDDRYDHVGEIKTEYELQNALQTHRPRGGTRVTEALRQTITRCKKRKGIYVIVVTDGEFADKLNLEQYLQNELMPLMTPDNPYAVRLHFVGAGEGADEAFLRRIETMASGRGVQMVTSHHHAHMSHSHDGILDELDRSFIGAGRNFQIGEIAGDNGEPVVTRIGNVVAREWYHGSSATFPFMPRHPMIGLEFKQLHPPRLEVAAEWHLAHSNDTETTQLSVPMPKVTDSAGGGSIAGSWKNIFAWTGQTPEEKAARIALEKKASEVYQAEMERQSIDLAELGKGGIPVQAKQRLQELGDESAHERSLFTSNLAPDEIALLRKHGYKVRGLITGSAVYHVGQTYASSTGDCQVKELTHAYDAATGAALSRMQQELALLKAHGAVGVRLNLVRHEWGEKTIEVQAVGTAIEGPGPIPASPWLCDLSGQEWFALHRAGYEPAALVYGHCSWFILTADQDQAIINSWQNSEFSHWSAALSQARHIALDSVHKQTKAAGGTGVAGVSIKRRLDHVHLTGGTGSVFDRTHHNLVISVIGTAIRVRDDAPQKVPATRHVLSLRDGRLKPMVMRQQADLMVE